MTEYTASSELIREYYSARDRTKNWVSNLTLDELYSPTHPHSELYDEDDGYAVSISDVASSHSVPPKLMLRYGDGRPDVMIPHINDPPSPSSHRTSRSQSQSRSSSTRSPPHQDPYITSSGSRSRSRVPSGKSHKSHRSREIPNVPEEIRILPSQSATHSRSKSLPRDTFSERNQSPSHIISQPILSPGAGPYPPPPPMPTHVNFSQTQSWHQQGRPPRDPPHIIYAPAHHSRNHYQPPVIYNYPPQIGPNGVVYSHSAPVPQHPAAQYPTMRGTPYPSAANSSAPRGSRSSSTRRPRSRSLPYQMPETPYIQASPTVSAHSLGSQASASTYYVLPHGRQKVHVLRTPDLSYSSSTPTQSPTSPISPGSGSSKKSFLQRVLGRFTSSSVSSQSGKHLHRSNSLSHSQNNRRR